VPGSELGAANVKVEALEVVVELETVTAAVPGNAVWQPKLRRSVASR